MTASFSTKKHTYFATHTHRIRIPEHGAPASEYWQFKAGAPPCSPHLKCDPTCQPWVPGEDMLYNQGGSASLSGGPVSSYRWCGVCSQPRALNSRLYPKTYLVRHRKVLPADCSLLFLKVLSMASKEGKKPSLCADGNSLTPSAVPGSSQLLAEDSPFFFFFNPNPGMGLLWVLYTHFVYTMQIPVD